MEQQMENQTERRSIEDRVSLSLAIDAHIRAQAKFRTALDACTEAAKNLQQMIGPSQRVVAKVDYRYYIVSSDSECAISVEPVECV